ncbi:hypothetical protein UACE39S_06044 [Ureibacillus acetophenoni]
MATYNQLSEQEKVIQIHTKNECLIYMLGFAPDFAFMGGMDEKIATPRKATPRLKIHAGSVGIAGANRDLSFRNTGWLANYWTNSFKVVPTRPKPSNPCFSR